jgi:hypothetical protein
VLLARRPLSISGHLGEPVPNVLVSSRAEPTGLCIVLPGYGYSSDGPLLRYPAFHLLGKGFDVFKVNYSYVHRSNFELQILYADVDAALVRIMNQSDYQRIIVIIVPRIPSEKLTAKIWISPNLAGIGIESPVLCSPGSLVVIGSEDRQFTADLSRILRRGGSAVAVIKGGDHGLEDLANMRRSLELVVASYEAIEQFIESVL